MADRPAVAALEVYFDFGSGNLTIQDNFLGDTNNTTGIIDFNQSLPGYQVQGTVDTGSGPNLVSIIGSPSASLRLTNFTAEAVGVPQYRLRVSMTNTLTGTFTGLTGGDTLDAYVGNSFASAVPVGTDEVQFWQGYLDLLTFNPSFGPTPPIPNPFLPASSAPVPYPLYGHGPVPLTGTFTNPILGADLYLYLGAAGDQLILYTSAEVGIGVVPEIGTSALLAAGLAALALGRVLSRGRKNHRSTDG